MEKSANPLIRRLSTRRDTFAALAMRRDSYFAGEERRNTVRFESRRASKVSINQVCALLPSCSQIAHFQCDHIRTDRATPPRTPTLARTTPGPPTASPRSTWRPSTTRRATTPATCRRRQNARRSNDVQQRPRVFFKKKIFYWFSYKKNDESRFIFLGHSRDTRMEGSVEGGAVHIIKLCGGLKLLFSPPPPR